MSRRDLRTFVRELESAGELHRVQAEVDAELEITEIAGRSMRSGGPALLFENVRGASYPLLINPLGSERRIEIALGREPESIGAMLLDLAHRANPPKPKALWEARSSIFEVLSMRTRRMRNAPAQEVVESPPDLSELPVQTTWPGDGGPFMTFAVAITHDPLTGERNTGLYRLQVFDKTTTGMHWQIVRGCGNHYARAEALGRPLETAVIVGADPALLLSAIAALPEGMDEIAFSGILAGGPCPMVRAKTLSMDVPANAEMVLEGTVAPGERRMEGPFGDHFGHYSHAAPFPVFEVSAVTRRRDPIYLSAVVGLPPQEDKYIGNATQEILGPLIKLIHPEIEEVWAYFEAGFHNLLVVSVRQRFYKEAVKTALALLGTGQLSLTKCLVLVDADVPVRDFDAVVRAIGENFDPDRDYLLLPGVPLDTLDFTSYRMNLGSKMVIDATTGETSALHGRPGADREAVVEAFGARPADLGEPATYGVGEPAPRSSARIPDPRTLDGRIEEFTVVEDTMLIVKVAEAGSEVVATLVRGDLGPIRLVAAVSCDVDLHDRENLIWGVFTRFDCARDVVFSRSETRGPWTTNYGVLGIDATFKPGYPDRLEMDPDVVARVDSRWAEYGLD
ncbi:MAG: UbiD family decarboxylase [Acidobacteria bacterium]|nr:UbiD family decarboxylase [Acidobacteriota bacterium]